MRCGEGGRGTERQRCCRSPPSESPAAGSDNDLQKDISNQLALCNTVTTNKTCADVKRQLFKTTEEVQNRSREMYSPIQQNTRNNEAQVLSTESLHRV